METNTKIISHEFAYHAPQKLEEALKLLRSPGAMLLAGGTDLINRLKLNTAQPSEVIYLGGVKELQEIDSSRGISFGAMVPMTAIERIKGLQESYTCLYEAIHSVGGQQIRNMATVAGNIANASPAADSPVALMVLGAVCELGLIDEQGKLVRRELPVEEIFQGPGKTSLKQGEMILSIKLPKIDGRSGCSFQKNARVKLDVAKASAAAFLQLDGDICEDIRVATGSVGPKPARAPHVEAALKGKKLEPDAIKAAAEEIEKDIKPITDVRSTDKYRRRIMRVLVRDAVEVAWKRADGGERR